MNASALQTIVEIFKHSHYSDSAYFNSVDAIRTLQQTEWKENIWLNIFV